MKTKFNSSFIIISALIVVAASLRILFNEYSIWNFSPVAAIALFSGVRFNDKKIAFIVPISIMLLTDFIIGVHQYMWSVYFSLSLVTVLGIVISKKENIISILFGSITSSVLFYLITNLVFFYSQSQYPYNLSGQIASYTAAIPFFGNTLMSDLFFNGVLFGSWYLIKRTNPQIVKA